MTEITAPSINRQQKIRVGKPAGRLVKKNPINTTKNFVKQGKYLTDAINGKGDDFSVGKINDLTTRLGSLGIAAMLATMTKNPVAKTMEFVGFTSFFASMALWPKMISTAVKAKAGFDVNQEYVDSYGRQKRFFEDPQYLPWDLWSSKQINKIGDKLNVPKDIENRSDETHKKMKQIATQSNTLWMMTAGFATPLMASLMGNYASKYVEKLTEATRVQKAINTTGIEDFRQADEGVKLSFKEHLNNIFVKKPAELFGKTKAIKDKDLKQTLIDLDSAYDSIFGKSNDAAYEFKKATLLYDNIPNNEKLVEYSERLGKNIVKDADGKVIKQIKTKNADGISMFGDKWKTIPNKMADILGITPKKLKAINNNINTSVVKDGIECNLSNEIADTLISKFAGKENKKELEKALNKMGVTLDTSIRELNKASESLIAPIDEAIANSKQAIQKEFKNISDKMLPDFDKKLIEMLGDNTLDRYSDQIAGIRDNIEQLGKATSSEDKKQFVKELEEGLSKLYDGLKTKSIPVEHRNIVENAKTLIEDRIKIEKVIAGEDFNSIQSLVKKAKASLKGTDSKDLLEKLKNIDETNNIRLYIAEAQKTRLENKIINTKVSWYSPVKILDIIAKTSNEENLSKEAKTALKKELTDYIYGVTPHHIHNDFDDVIKGDFPSQLARYNAGIKKYFGNGKLNVIEKVKDGNETKLTDFAKTFDKDLTDKCKTLLNDVESTNKNLAKKFLCISTEKTKHFNDICEWLGKTPVSFIEDATKQNGIYRGWLKKVGGAFAILSGITVLAISQFGKANKYNPNTQKQN